MNEYYYYIRFMLGRVERSRKAYRAHYVWLLQQEIIAGRKA